MIATLLAMLYDDCVEDEASKKVSHKLIQMTEWFLKPLDRLGL